MAISPRSRLILPSILLLCSFVWNGCLTAERKETRFTIRPDGSGTGTITFTNIMSVEEDGKDNSSHDYPELVKKYFKGSKFEDENPAYQNVKKRLFEKDGKLNGELTFDFGNYEDIGLYRYEKKGPWMYYIGSHSDLSVEKFDTSNGTRPHETLPVLFWADSTTEFRIVDRFEDPGQPSRTLLPLFTRYGTGEDERVGK